MNIEKNAYEEVRFLHNKAKKLIQQKCEEKDIISQLKLEGINENYAELIIENVKNDLINKRNGLSYLIIGISAIITGLAAYCFSNPISQNSISGAFKIMCLFVGAGILMVTKGIYSYKKAL